MVLGTALAIIGIIVVIIGLLAVLGLSSIVPGEAVASGIQGAFTVFFNWWQLWAPLLIIAVVAYIARGGRGGGSSATDTIVGAAEGVTRGLRGDGGDPEPDPTPEPPTNPPTNPPSTPDDDTGGGDDSQSQQQQQMQQMMMALLQGNLSQGGNGNFVSYGPQQQQQQQMFGGLSPGVYSTFMQQINMMQMNQQTMMQQMMQFMQQNNYQKVDNQFIIQFMKQVLDVDIDEGDVKEGDVIVQINQVIQQINITQIEQNIEKVIQKVNIADINYIEQFIEILIAIKEGDIKKEGDIIAIFAHQEIRIQPATLMTFLNILQVIKYDELKAMIVQLNKLSQDISWEARIEQLIIVYREGNGAKETGLDVDLSGSNWKVFLRTIEQIEFNNNLKREALSILKEDRDIRNTSLSIAEIANIRDCIKGMPKEDVPKAGQEFVSYLQSYNGLNSKAIDEFIDYLLSKWPVNREYLKNENHYQSMATPNIVDGTEERLQELIQEIENQEQIERHTIQLDEDAVKSLKQAINAFERERNFIMAVRQISTDLEQNSIGNIGQEIREINQELGENLFDEENARQHIQDLEKMSQNLEQAIEDLKEADHELEQVEQSDVNMEETLKKVEQSELNMTKQARTVLQKIHN